MYRFTAITIIILVVTLNMGAQTPAPMPVAGVNFPGAGADKKTKYTYSIIPTDHKTWGYDIYTGKTLFIHQPNIPGLPGNDGFKTRSGAEKVALLVIGKIKKGEIPPNVTPEEMKKLKVL